MMAAATLEFLRDKLSNDIFSPARFIHTGSTWFPFRWIKMIKVLSAYDKE